MKEIAWAENTTQDKIEEAARKNGWKVVTSSATETVLVRWCGTIAIKFATREQHGQIRTVINSFSVKVSSDSFDKFELANELIERLGLPQ